MNLDPEIDKFGPQIRDSDQDLPPNCVPVQLSGSFFEDFDKRGGPGTRFTPPSIMFFTPPYKNEADNFIN